MKKYALVFLSVFLFISAPFAAHANIVTATGKYLINAVKHVPGAVRVDATNTATGAKHVIKHGISSADLGKGIGAGIVGMAVGSGVGLAFQAITGLALDAVDWVLDPANNRVVYQSGEYGGSDLSMYRSRCLQDAKAYVQKLGINPYWATQTARVVYPSGNQNANYVVCEAAMYMGDTYNKEIARYPITGGGGEQYLPIDTLAQKVIANAEAGQVDSQKTIEDYVTHLAKEGKLDTELDNSSDITPSEEPENPEEPNPDEPQQCPSGTVKVDDVCVKIPDSDGDEPLFCDSSEFTKKVCDWIDWTQTEHDELEPDAGKVDIKDKSEDLSIDNDRIDFSNQCPAPTPINTSVGGFPVSTELNYQPLCDFFTMLNPFVVGMGGISSALIIAGGARRG